MRKAYALESDLLSHSGDLVSRGERPLMARLPQSYTLDSLQQFFTHIAANYAVFPFRDWQGQSGIVLRQDVDLDLGLARAFADLQRSLGLRSTFFVLLTSDCYNVWSASSRMLLRSLVEDGFEVGLHFDPTIDDDPGRVYRETEQLAELCASEVSSVSLHNPTSRGEFPLYEGLLNAYDPRLFSPESYLSDSCQNWRHDPWEFVLRAASQTVQLLFHPCHYSVRGRGYLDAFSAHVDGYLDTLDAAFRPFNARYRERIEPNLKEWYRRQS